MNVRNSVCVAARVFLPFLLVAGCHRATTVKTEGLAAPYKVACIGDSITFGAGVENRDQNSYPKQLGQMLGSQWEVRSFGVSGATLLKRGDLPYWKQKAFEEALAFRPDVVVIMLGTNDSKPQNWQYKNEFVADYVAMIEAFRKVNPKAQVYVCLPVPAFPGDWGIRESVIKGEVIPAVREVAAKSKARVIDLYRALEGKGELVPDKVHPNAAGAKVMAETIYRALTGKAAPGAKVEGKKAA